MDGLFNFYSLAEFGKLVQLVEKYEQYEDQPPISDIIDIEKNGY